MTNNPPIISVNGLEFAFEAGESILDVAQRNGIDIPTLCHDDRLTPAGACRLCVVEVTGLWASSTKKIASSGHY